MKARPFYAYKICNLCLKQPILSCALAPSRVERTRQTRRHSSCRVARTRQTRRHSPSRVVRTRQTRLHSPSRVARTRQTHRHSPKAIFEKNVTRLDTFARVIRHSREFGASGHCLNKSQNRVTRSDNSSWKAWPPYRFWKKYQVPLPWIFNPYASIVDCCKKTTQFL